MPAGSSRMYYVTYRLTYSPSVWPYSMVTFSINNGGANDVVVTSQCNVTNGLIISLSLQHIGVTGVALLTWPNADVTPCLLSRGVAN